MMKSVNLYDPVCLRTCDCTTGCTTGVDTTVVGASTCMLSGCLLHSPAMEVACVEMEGLWDEEKADVDCVEESDGEGE